MQYIPPSRLEGIPLDNIKESTPYIPGCPILDREVRQLHGLARSGAIPVEVAERQLNTYLLAAAYPAKKKGGPALRWLVMPLTDAPHHGLLPDLGQIIHRVLARDPIPCALSAVVEQCIPCFRHATRVICYSKDSQETLLNLVLGLLLGLYPGSSVKKPSFRSRVVLFEQVHRLLVSQQQAEFCKAHEAILMLACMEYVARVLPVYMPAQAQLLMATDSTTAGFFRRIPILCDDLRQWLDDEPGEGSCFWGRIQAACASKVEQVSRLKRCHIPHPAARIACDPPSVLLAQDGGSLRVTDYWDVPLLHGGSPDEYRLLALGLGLKGGVIQHIQRELQVYPLPPNLSAIQARSLQHAARSAGDMVHLQTFR